MIWIISYKLKIWLILLVIWLCYIFYFSYIVIFFVIFLTQGYLQTKQVYNNGYLLSF